MDPLYKNGAKFRNTLLFGAIDRTPLVQQIKAPGNTIVYEYMNSRAEPEYFLDVEGLKLEMVKFLKGAE